MSVNQLKKVSKEKFDQHKLEGRDAILNLSVTETQRAFDAVGREVLMTNIDENVELQNQINSTLDQNVEQIRTRSKEEMER